jgi:hypothetical protein
MHDKVTNDWLHDEILEILGKLSHSFRAIP